jgi:tRNA(Ile)-lysidine synthase
MHDKSKKLPVNKFFSSIEKIIDFSIFQTIYVGFSGGADSTALLIILKTLSEKYKLQLAAVHFEHGLRGNESVNDALWCKKFCLSQKIEYIEFNLDVKGSLLSNEGIESCARRLRMEKLSSLVKIPKSPVSVCCATTPWQTKSSNHPIAKPLNAVALGHHKNDKIENLFIRLIRGSNCSGLTSLRHSTVLKGINILRPLLNLSKQEIEAFLVENNITDWRVDATNQENIYRRNIIRNKILPELHQSIPESKAGILRAEEALKEDAEYLELTSKTEYRKLFNKASEFPKALSVQTLLIIHTAIRARVLRYWLTDLLGFEFIPNRDFLKRIDCELKRKSKEQILIPLSKETFLKLEKGYVSLFEFNSQSELINDIWNWKVNPKIQIGNYSLEARTIDKNFDIKIENENYVYFDYSLMPDTLHIRAWKEGDRFIPFGSNNSIKVKRVFKNEKISPSLRKQFPLLCLPDDTIIWIAGLKRSNYAPVNKVDTKIILFTVT